MMSEEDVCYFRERYCSDCPSEGDCIGFCEKMKVALTIRAKMSELEDKGVRFE